MYQLRKTLKYLLSILSYCSREQRRTICIVFGHKEVHIRDKYLWNTWGATCSFRFHFENHLILILGCTIAEFNRINLSNRGMVLDNLMLIIKIQLQRLFVGNTGSLCSDGLPTARPPCRDDLLMFSSQDMLAS